MTYTYTGHSHPLIVTTVDAEDLLNMKRLKGIGATSVLNPKP